MTRTVSVTHTSALILQAVASGYSYGFDIIGITGLPSGTVYPALRRLEEAGLVRSWWENDSSARKNNRPARRYYQIRRSGEKALAEAVKRYRHLAAIRPVSPPSASRA